MLVWSKLLVRKTVVQIVLLTTLGHIEGLIQLINIVSIHVWCGHYRAASDVVVARTMPSLAACSLSIVRTCRPRQFDTSNFDDRQPPRDTIEVHCLATSTDRKHG
jgi:hypothetical protein